jgi:hypothetical protein
MLYINIFEKFNFICLFEKLEYYIILKDLLKKDFE